MKIALALLCASACGWTQDVEERRLAKVPEGFVLEEMWFGPQGTFLYTARSGDKTVLFLEDERWEFARVVRHVWEGDGSRGGKILFWEASLPRKEGSTKKAVGIGSASNAKFFNRIKQMTFSRDGSRRRLG